MEEKVKETKKVVTPMPDEKLAKLERENYRLKELLSNYEIQLERMNNALSLERVKLLFKIVENSLMFPDSVLKKAVDEITEVFGFNDEPANTEATKPEE